jgi:hypothetical protein
MNAKTIKENIVAFLAMTSLAISTGFAVVDPSARTALYGNVNLILGAYLALIKPDDKKKED